jgi:uncharacterized damage-inducible protein DinB
MSHTLTALMNREFFVRRYSQEVPAFLDVFKALPASRLDYRPHPASRSAGELVALLVATHEGCMTLCEKGNASINSTLYWHSSTRSASLEEMIGVYERSHAALAARLRSMDDTTWGRAAWLMRTDQDLLLKDTIGGLLWLALFDGVHHRGQLSTYIRPMGGKVPSIYGPSGDAPARGQ